MACLVVGGRIPKFGGRVKRIFKELMLVLVLIGTLK